jgi:hypothetical protein
MPVIRVNYRRLTPAQRQSFVNALLKLKREGNPGTGRNYDTYVRWHYQMMQAPDMSQMLAHMSPMFLPWHRQFLLLLEQDLQAVSRDPTLAIPYWYWSAADAGANEPLWADDFLGGNGQSGDNKVMTGPFAFDRGDWTLVIDEANRNYLTRAFGSSAAAPNLPPQSDVDALGSMNTYDVSPWDMDADIQVSFRNNLEGWGAGQPRLHNQVHVWVGGENATLALATSPNDPVFFLHHANIDRIWAAWQDADASRTYLPTTEQPNRPGVSLNATMPLFPSLVTPAQVLDYRALGYQYDTSPPAAAVPRVFAMAAPRPRPMRGFKPFRGFIAADPAPRQPPTIVRLMQVAPAQHDRAWLEEALQAAAELELATIPPYLCAWWSVQDPNDPVADLLRGIVIQEMGHMGLACNLLTTLDGTPRLATPDAVPKYPGPLPGGVRPGLIVRLQGLTKEVIADTFMKIEYPEAGPIAMSLGQSFPTIGAFYDAIWDAFQQLPASAITGKRQLVSQGAGLFRILSMADVERAIKQIKQQGEGTAQSPEAAGSSGELAHYYKFAEMYHSRTLVKAPDGFWKYEGDPIAFPAVYPMVPVPPEGYPESHDFDVQFSAVLGKLQNAWATGTQSILGEAIGLMFSLSDLARTLMQQPLPGGGGTYGPSFKVVV